MVVTEAAWTNLRSCWFNSLYARVMPSDAVELTAAYLDHSVAATLARNHLNAVSLHQQQQLAAVIHLCGAAAGDIYLRRGFRVPVGQRCGDHDVRAYLARIHSMSNAFERLGQVQL
jgi:hypothetical protein